MGGNADQTQGKAATRSISLPFTEGVCTATTRVWQASSLFAFGERDVTDITSTVRYFPLLLRFAVEP